MAIYTPALFLLLLEEKAAHKSIIFIPMSLPTAGDQCWEDLGLGKHGLLCNKLS